MQKDEERELAAWRIVLGQRNRQERWPFLRGSHRPVGRRHLRERDGEGAPGSEPGRRLVAETGTGPQTNAQQSSGNRGGSDELHCVPGCLDERLMPAKRLA